MDKFLRTKRIATKSKILSNPIEYNNLLQRATLNTIKVRRLVVDFETSTVQVVFCVGATTNGQYKQFKQKIIGKDKEEDVLNVLGIDNLSLQDNILKFVEEEINAAATTANNQGKITQVDAPV